MDLNPANHIPAKSHKTKMLWYFDAIIDWMIANPGRPLYECAAHVNRTPTTISAIVNSDMFKAALAARKVTFQAQHDLGLIEKTTKIANASLDAILEHLDKKRDKIPLNTLTELSDSALTRLGYGVTPLTPPMVQNNQVNNTVVVQATPEDLEIARMALRQVQANAAKQLPASKAVEPFLELPASEAGSATSDVAEVHSAPPADAT